MFKAAFDILISISFLIENSKLGHCQGPELEDSLKNLIGDLGREDPSESLRVGLKVNPPGRADPAHEKVHKVVVGTVWNRPGPKMFL